MKWMSCVLLIAAAACTAGDDTTDGARGFCAAGGALNQCPASAQTPEAACSRLVACGAIPLNSDDNMTNAFDWARCMNRMGRADPTQTRLMVSCILASACDQLKVPGSPDDPDTGQMHCLGFGGQR
jgi:hypothetical protein